MKMGKIDQKHDRAANVTAADAAQKSWNSGKAGKKVVCVRAPVICKEAWGCVDKLGDVS